MKENKKMTQLGRGVSSFIARRHVKAGELLTADDVRARVWYEYVTPFLGLKWGAEVTLIVFVGLYQRESPGYVAAAAIVAVFLVLEWCTMAYKDFKRG